MYSHSLKSKDGKRVYHGTIIHWFPNTDEFLFIPVGGLKLEPWWCKEDFWSIVHHWETNKGV